MIKDDLKPSDIMTKNAFENAIRTNGAIGGSTNCIIHLAAIAGRLGIEIDYQAFDTMGRETRLQTGEEAPAAGLEGLCRQ